MAACKDYVMEWYIATSAENTEWEWYLAVSVKYPAVVRRGVTLMGGA